jgi:hypothetical protein
LHHGTRSDSPVGSKPIFNEKLLPEIEAKLLCYRAGLHVRAATGGIANNHLHRMIRILFRLRRHRL